MKTKRHSHTRGRHRSRFHLTSLIPQCRWACISQYAESEAGSDTAQESLLGTEEDEDVIPERDILPPLLRQRNRPRLRSTFITTESLPPPTQESQTMYLTVDDDSTLGTESSDYNDASNRTSIQSIYHCNQDSIVGNHGNNQTSDNSNTNSQSSNCDSQVSNHRIQLQSQLNALTVTADTVALDTNSSQPSEASGSQDTLGFHGNKEDESHHSNQSCSNRGSDSINPDLEDIFTNSLDRNTLVESENQNDNQITIGSSSCQHVAADSGAPNRGPTFGLSNHMWVGQQRRHWHWQDSIHGNPGGFPGNHGNNGGFPGNQDNNGGFPSNRLFSMFNNQTTFQQPSRVLPFRPIIRQSYQQGGFSSSELEEQTRQILESVQRRMETLTRGQGSEPAVTTATQHGNNTPGNQEPTPSTSTAQEQVSSQPDSATSTLNSADLAGDVVSGWQATDELTSVPGQAAVHMADLSNIFRHHMPLAFTACSPDPRRLTRNPDHVNGRNETQGANGSAAGARETGGGRTEDSGTGRLSVTSSGSGSGRLHQDWYFYDPRLIPEGRTQRVNAQTSQAGIHTTLNMPGIISPPPYEEVDPVPSASPPPPTVTITTSSPMATNFTLATGVDFGLPSDPPPPFGVPSDPPPPYVLDEPPPAYEQSFNHQVGSFLSFPQADNNSALVTMETPFVDIAALLGQVPEDSETEESQEGQSTGTSYANSLEGGSTRTSANNSMESRSTRTSTNNSLQGHSTRSGGSGNQGHSNRPSVSERSEFNEQTILESEPMATNMDTQIPAVSHHQPGSANQRQTRLSNQRQQNVHSATELPNQDESHDQDETNEITEMADLDADDDDDDDIMELSSIQLHSHSRRVVGQDHHGGMGQGHGQPGRRPSLFAMQGSPGGLVSMQGSPGGLVSMQGSPGGFGLRSRPPLRWSRNMHMDRWASNSVWAF